MSSDAFLKGRQERDAARLARTQAGPGEMTVLRNELLAELQQLADATRDATTHEVALESWRQLQVRIQSAADTDSLPAREMQRWNATLGSLSAGVEGLRSASKSTKKFAFSSKKASSTPSTPLEQRSASSIDLQAASQGTASPVDEDAPAGGVLYRDLKRQTVFVDIARAVFVRRCEDCVFLALPTAGSFFLSDCVGCRVYVCCHQMRVKSCRSCDVYVWCSSIPVIESCEDMRFGPYDAWRGLTQSTVHGNTCMSHAAWATSVGEQQDITRAADSWRTIDDFHWLKQSQSPNWSLLSDYSVSDVVFEVASTPTLK